VLLLGSEKKSALKWHLLRGLNGKEGLKEYDLNGAPTHLRHRSLAYSLLSLYFEHLGRGMKAARLPCSSGIGGAPIGRASGRCQAMSAPIVAMDAYVYQSPLG
jgi:hypothetical protein